MDRNIGKVMVVGAGVAGIRAALDLAETGYEVILTESSPAIGGILAKLDYQFPTDHCGMCRMLPFIGREHASQFCMRKTLFHDNITIVPDTEVISCEGEPGAFQVTLRHRARWVDTTVCMGEGDCLSVCPVEVKDEFNEGLTLRKAIYRPVPHNLPNLFDIDRAACTKCGECVTVCPVNAINLDEEDTEEVVTVGAVVLAAGAGLYAAGTEPDFYAYSRSPNVMTSLEFERVLSASGTSRSGGPLKRPHDGKAIERIAWLSCVGSRNRKAGRDFCSAVCCMFSLKEAVLAKERGGDDTDVTIFYMDMRTYGKDYYKYRVSAEEKGVRLVRCRAHTILEGDNGDALIRYFGSDGQTHEEPYDLVVLATGQAPPTEAKQLKSIFGFDLNVAGFVATDGDYGVKTSSPGIFACGSMTGLKDISESVLQGSAAALEASTVLQTKGSVWQDRTPAFKERDVARELPRVAVILCRWPLKEGARGVDFDRLAEIMNSHDHVFEVHVVDEVCRSGFDEALEILKSSKSNRVLFAACLPYIYKKRLKEAALEAGFNLALVEVVDLRGHIRKLLHLSDGVDVEKMALAQMLAKVEELRVKDAVKTTNVAVVPRALVIGGGLSGMKAALTLSRHGVEVVLVERDSQIGGHARKLHYALEGFDPVQLANTMADEVRADRGITVYTSSEISQTSGSVGRFHSVIKTSNGEGSVKVDHATTIVATGGYEAPTEEYEYGKSDVILTQEQLEIALVNGDIGADDLGTIVMIQCVGSREPGKREYCSRLCCSAALKNAHKILDLNPKARVIVLYRDMMAYGFKERYYTEARARGVIFSAYDLDHKPSVALDDEGKPTVNFTDEVLRREIKVKPDYLVLSTGIVPTDTTHLADILGLEHTDEGFLRELDYKWKPVDTLKEGVYICGLAHSPRSIPEALVMAEAAAQQALTVLSHKEISTAKLVSRVRESLCTTCEICVGLCPYNARVLDGATGTIVVDELACQGCGICVAGCPSGAATFSSLLERQVMAAIDSQLLDALVL